MEAYIVGEHQGGRKSSSCPWVRICVSSPDGIYFNTEDYSDNGYMGHENTVDAAETPISVSLCLADGQALTLSFSQAAQPESPSNGQYWLDTSGSLHSIKQWGGLGAVGVRADGVCEAGGERHRQGLQTV